MGSGRPVESRSWPSERFELIALLTLAGLALLAVLIPERITASLAWRLPDAMQTRSAGTYFPAFGHEDGFVLQLVRLGWITLTALLLTFAGRLPIVQRAWDRHLPTEFSEAGFRYALTVLGLLAGGVFLYFGWWPDAFPSNARIHWVDGYYERADRHAHALVKFTAQLFYDRPRLLVALLGATNTVLFACVVRELVGSRMLAIVAGASFLASSNLLLFAGMSEDVLLSSALLLGTSYAFLRRAPVAFGVIGFLASTARLTHIGLFLALWGCAWLAGMAKVGRWWRVVSPLRDPLLARSLGVFLTLTLLWHGFLVAIGQHNLLFNDDNTYTNLTAQQSIPIDGYLISRFDGSATLHMLWVLPVPAVGLWSLMVLIHRLRDGVGVFVAGCTLFTLANVLLVEHLKMYYFNVRYISYYFPLVLALAWAGTTRIPRDLGTLRTCLLIVLTCCVIAPYNHAPERRERLRSYPLSQLFEHRLAIRAFLSECELTLTDQGNRSQRNYLSYLLRAPASRIRDIGDGPLPSGACLVALGAGELPTVGEDWEELDLGTDALIVRPRL